MISESLECKPRLSYDSPGAFYFLMKLLLKGNWEKRLYWNTSCSKKNVLFSFMLTNMRKLEKLYEINPCLVHDTSYINLIQARLIRFKSLSLPFKLAVCIMCWSSVPKATASYYTYPYMVFIVCSWEALFKLQNNYFF